MADGITLKGAGSNSPKQFQGLFVAIPFKCTFEDDSIAANTVYDGGETVSVPGAQLGDFVLVAPELDPADLFFQAAVTAADTVTVTLVNNTGGALTTFAAGAVVNGVVLRLRDSLWDEITTVAT